MDARVTIDSNDERVAQGASLFKALDVARMKQIKAAICKNDAAPATVTAAELLNDAFPAENTRMQNVSRGFLMDLREGRVNHYFITHDKTAAFCGASGDCVHDESKKVLVCGDWSAPSGDGILFAEYGAVPPCASYVERRKLPDARGCS